MKKHIDIIINFIFTTTFQIPFQSFHLLLIIFTSFLHTFKKLPFQSEAKWT